MRQYSKFVTELTSLFERAATSRQCDADAVECALDGQANAELCRLVAKPQRYRDGAYFTGTKMASSAAGYLKDVLRNGGTVCDPACGAGNLLLACAKHLPLSSSLSRTIASWEKSLIGRDLHSEFIEAARVRLALLAVQRATRTVRRVPDVSALFPDVAQGCGLNCEETLAACNAIILNPPFNSVKAPEGCEWGHGKVNQSAVFMEHCIQHAGPETKLAAILPDVLRSGSRYSKWRRLIARETTIERIELLERFDRNTDVHVFVLGLKKRREKIRSTPGDWPALSAFEGRTVGDLFSISVGPVVDYRDEHRGPWCPFLVARDLAKWSVVRRQTSSRRFAGTTAEAPFVVIRRTSRPEDLHRAVGTIISGKQEWAVENHLLVARPADGTVSSCRKLLAMLKSPNTTRWLNERIRCRHLTVSAVRSIPWHEQS